MVDVDAKSSHMEDTDVTRMGTGDEEMERQDHSTPLASQYSDAISNRGDAVTSNTDPCLREEDDASAPNTNRTTDEHDRPNMETAQHGHATRSPENYLPGLHQKVVAHRARDLVYPGSTPSSTGSLHTLSEEEGGQAGLKRAYSTRSTQSGYRGRSISQSKAVLSTPFGYKCSSHGDHFYPDQSFAQLSKPVLGARPQPVLRTRSSHPAQNLLYNDMSKSAVSPTHGRRTADNTPISSPGLFALSVERHATSDSMGATNSQLHHLQAPKETHTAEIEHDVYSGNKFINNYEVVTELGRGEHGKVKLGRDIERDTMVAIKIVPRYSAKRRLGKLGAPEDRTKGEVAILKKARHPNVVSLLEVIDDPSKNKVYLILEFVDRGEIKWRKTGVKEILAVNYLRFNQEKYGARLSTEPTDRDLHVVRQAQVRHERLEQLRKHHKDWNHIPNWSLEYAGDTDDESEIVEVSRTISRQMTRDSVPSRSESLDDYVGVHEPSLVGSMYGAYAPDAYRARKFSVAASAVSHMSSDVGFETDDDQYSFVPALTLEEARRAFRDTLVGLEFLHFIGIIHRDIKPANLLTSSNCMVKISDFGVSYLGRPTTEDEAEEKANAETAPLDNEKELARSVGTPAFWAPELCYEDPSMFADGKEPKITGALDLWALGITLYCMIYARLPFYSNDDMGLHEAICTATVFCPRTRLVPVDTTSSDFISRSTVPINGNKRLDYELKFEYVPESVRDLIGRLLTKDPAQRITIAEAKRHPWVVEDLSDQTQWLQGPIEKEGKKKILDINEKELSHAVVKRNIIERALTSAGRFAGSLLGRSASQKRASSTTHSAGSSSESLHPPSIAVNSNGGKPTKSRETRRTSLRGDEVVQALKASREPSDHPLAQSQTASPEIKEQPSYFEAPKAASTGATPLELGRRPRAPDRAISALSTAESVKTIRASQQQSVERHADKKLLSKFEGLWEGTARSLSRFANREHSDSRSRSTSQPTSENDGHAGPSLAVSNAYAAGAISKPNVLEALDMALEAESRDGDGRSTQTLIHAPMSSSMEFEKAQHINQRRHIQELHGHADTSVGPLSTDTSVYCPPSPDDVAFVGESTPASTELKADRGIPTAASASTISSSVDGLCDSSVSNPSFGMASGASSPPDGFSLTEYKDPAGSIHMSTEPEFMRTADTITTYEATAAGKALEQQHEIYDGGEDDGDFDDDDEDDDDDGMVMSLHRR